MRVGAFAQSSPFVAQSLPDLTVPYWVLRPPSGMDNFGPEQVVIKDQASFAVLWKKLYASRAIKAQIPNIDFTHETVFF